MLEIVALITTCSVQEIEFAEGTQTQIFKAKCKIVNS